MKKLTEIMSVVGFLGIVSCASTGITVPIRGPIDKTEPYHLIGRDYNDNGLIDRYTLEGKGMGPEEYAVDPERPLGQLITDLRKQGLNITSAKSLDN